MSSRWVGGGDELVALAVELGLEVERAVGRAAGGDEREVAAVEHLAQHRHAPASPTTTRA